MKLLVLTSQLLLIRSTCETREITTDTTRISLLIILLLLSMRSVWSFAVSEEFVSETPKTPRNYACWGT